MLPTEVTVGEQRNRKIVGQLHRLQSWISAPTLAVQGKITQLVGLTMVAEGCLAAVGSRCLVDPGSTQEFEAEVVGFAEGKLYLMPIGVPQGLSPGARVIPTGHSGEVMMGDALLGRVVDGAGLPLDGLGPIRCKDRVKLHGDYINPFRRTPIREPLDVGVRAVNALLTVGRGQRMGLFARSGVGKSTLLGLMLRYTEADIVVVGLIGERGREVREFVEEIVGARDANKVIVVATPADDPPLMRIHGAWLATSIAEYYRSRGANVLLLMDSLTRFAQAQREIALAIGEPPATRGYPPSVFVQLPKLVERSGNGDGDSQGSITAFYTILVEGDDQSDPVAESARAILDGHIVLSSQLAEAGVYPAIDVEASISRVMSHIASEQHQQTARKFKEIYSNYQHNRDLISVGAYQQGSDPAIDTAIREYPNLLNFLRQGIQEQAGFDDSLARLTNMAQHWSDQA